MDHSSLTVTPVEGEREREFQQLMQEHHYLGALRKIGNTIRYVAAVDGHWLGLLSFSAAALKCAARDEWIGWSGAHRTDRLKLVANNSRFLFCPAIIIRTSLRGLCRVAGDGCSATGWNSSRNRCWCWKHSWIRRGTAAPFIGLRAGRRSAPPRAIAVPVVAIALAPNRSSGCSYKLCNAMLGVL